MRPLGNSNFYFLFYLSIAFSSQPHELDSVPKKKPFEKKNIGLTKIQTMDLLLIFFRYLTARNHIGISGNFEGHAVRF